MHYDDGVQRPKLLPLQGEAIDIYVDRDSPVMVKQSHIDLLNAQRSESIGFGASVADSAFPEEQSPSARKMPLRASQKNYFSKGQEGKALAHMLKTMSSQKGLSPDAREHGSPELPAVDQSYNDQNFGGRHEKHDSQHQSALTFLENGADDDFNQSMAQQQWHDLKVIEGEDGRQELVIENLE